ncbi:MAG: hypothetical protein WCS42_00680 [Verrucomicrobiota bacterium]
MKLPVASHKNDLQRYVLSLAEGCPLDQCNPKDCPLHEVRKLKQKDRLSWLQALTEDDAKHLASYHHVCLSMKPGSEHESPRKKNTRIVKVVGAAGLEPAT